MGESYFWKPFAQGVATPIVLIGGTNLLLKDFKVSNPYLYWGGLAASSALVLGVLADKVKLPLLNAESIHGDERLDRWVENNYGDEYDWALLNEYGEYDEWDDAYDILEDFIVLDDDGNEHKGIAIIHREEYDAETEVFNASMYKCPDCSFTGYQEEFLEPVEDPYYDAETFNSDSHTDSFMADMPVNAVKNNDGWYIPSINRNDYKEVFKNWKPSKYPYEKRITQDSVDETCNSCGKENVHYQFYLPRTNSVNPKMRFIDDATYCQYDTNDCGGNICGDCAENATCENCGAEICTFCEEENNYEHSDLVCVECREFDESLEDD